MRRSLRCAEGCRPSPRRSCSNARRDPPRASSPRPAGAPTRERLWSPHCVRARCAELGRGSCHALARARCSARMREWPAGATARQKLVTAKADQYEPGRMDESIALHRWNVLAAAHAPSGAVAEAKPAASDPQRLSDPRDRRRPRTASAPATWSRTHRQAAFARCASGRKESLPCDRRCAKTNAAMDEASEAASQTHPRARDLTGSRLAKARRKRRADESANSMPPSTWSSEVTHARGRHHPSGAPSAAAWVSTRSRDRATWASGDGDRMLRLPGARRAPAIDAREACRSRAS